MKNPKLYTATINHKHGVNLYTALSQAGLQSQLYEYVKEYWSEGMDGKLPKNKETAIERYFEDEGALGEMEYLEYFEPQLIKNIHP